MDIILYTKPGCPLCNVLKHKLNDAGIKFTNIESVDEMIRLGFQRAPMLCVGDEKLEFGEAIEWVKNH